jgi:hypothetical protein
LPILEIITLARASRLTLFQLLNAIILCNRNYRWICQQWRLMGSHIDTRHVETRWNPFKTYACFPGITSACWTIVGHYYLNWKI